uniref:Longiborneol synthase CLM1 (Terpene cyclase CLM1)) n=1 Tax=Ganoderma boninense TaxID=34458 RepID=A0A5K1JT92_9APHY|nr:Longiborneol synthase CLM1 (EC (Culmorin biosynthesis protein 1) (Terpene cyclase CLM1) [Ganoderma boninense]
MPPARATSSSRALEAILPLIASGQPYEAHQKARTFASRYNKSAQYDTAIDVLFQSARELLKRGQQGSGTDLTAFLVDVYENKSETVNDESRGRLTQLIALAGASGSWRKSIIDKSIAWSAKAGPHPGGDPDLHHYVGELLYKEPYFLAAGKRDSARLLAEAFVQWAGPEGPAGAFALRGTLPYLQNGNILAARTFIVHFVSQMTSRRPSLLSSHQPTPIPVGKPADGEQDEITFTTDPAVNFTQLAVRTCQRAQGEKNKALREAWVRLCGTYQSRGGDVANKEVRKALVEIAELYFAIPPPRAQQANPFGDVISAMFGGGAPSAAPARRTLTPAAPTSAPGLD